MGLVLVTTGLGFLLGAAGSADWARLLATVVGTALVGGGASGFNQWWEVAADARMRRTRERPFPSKRITGRAGFAFSSLLTLAGLATLTVFTNGLTVGLAFASWAVYLFVYTPMKPLSTLNTIVGAVSGAIPPVMGWTAATGELGAGAWVLFSILFIWQIPHFLAIAWIYREDYENGGFRMLPVVDPTGRATFRIAVVYCLGLLPASYAAAIVGMTGWIYLLGATILGFAMLGAAIRLVTEGTEAAARRLFLTSIVYLPILLLLMILDPTRLPLR
jgi:protoheme IX farnesyltransferase